MREAPSRVTSLKRLAFSGVLAAGIIVGQFVSSPVRADTLTTCKKLRGTWTCLTTSSPGNSPKVGNTLTTTSQGNLTNKSLTNCTSGTPLKSQTWGCG